MIREAIIKVDKRGVMDSQGILIPGYKKVYLRTAGRDSVLDSEQLKHPYAMQGYVVGWFATKANMASGYTIQELSPEERDEFGKNAFRIISLKGTTVAQINLKKGTVRFADNEYYADNMKMRYKSPMAFHRLFIDNTNKAKKAFGV